RSVLRGCRAGGPLPTGELHEEPRHVHPRQHYFDEPRVCGVRGTLEGVLQLADGADLRGAYIGTTEGGGQLCPVPRDDVLIVGVWTLEQTLDRVTVVVEHEH